MRIFEPVNQSGYQFAHPASDEDFELLNVGIDGTPRLTQWSPVKMRLVSRDEHGRALLDSDSPWLGSHALILRPRAAQAMRSLVSTSGELLPLSCDETQLFVFNPRGIVGALDESASVIWRYPSSGRIGWVDTYAFVRQAITGLHAFKIDALRVSPTFVSEVFVDQWRQARLRGVDFREVWAG